MELGRDSGLTGLELGKVLGTYRLEQGEGLKGSELEEVLKTYRFGDRG